MKAALSALLISIALVPTVQSKALAVPVAGVTAQRAGTLYTCDGPGLSHVALQVQPAACCNGQFGCPQLLSNTGVPRSKRDRHT